MLTKPMQASAWRLLRPCAVMLSLLLGLGTSACRPAADPPPQAGGPQADTPPEADARGDDVAPRDGDGDGDERHPMHGEEAEGRWRKVQEPAPEELSAEQRQMIEKLRSIGYAAGSVEVERRGITVHREAEIWAGLNFYSSGRGPEAVLMDMEGKELHRWRKAFEEVWPDAKKDRRRLGAKWWRRVYLYPNGDVLAIFGGLGIIKVDKSSRLIWARKNNAHHDLEVMADGDIFVLTREPQVVEWVHPVEPTLEDFLSILDHDGVEQRRVSILEAMRRSPYKDYVFQGVTKTGDVMHTNSVHVLDGGIAGRMPAFRAGNVLTSMNALGVLAVLDPEREEIVWALKSPPHGQHDPQILDNGNLLVFDNRRDTRRSVVVELALPSLAPVWEYGGPELPFYSRTCGAVQRLPNGNTLVTESDGGRAFELTAGREIVWEFYTPHRAGDNGEYIATVAEMLRLPSDFPTDWLP